MPSPESAPRPRPRAGSLAARLEVTPELTLPKLLTDAAREVGEGRVALRAKRFGLWRTYTWTGYLEEVRLLALGFLALGLRRGDHVVIASGSRVEALWAELAALAVGAVAVAIHPEASGEALGRVVGEVDARLLIGETGRQASRALAAEPVTAKPERVIWMDPAGLRGLTDPRLLGLAEVRELGRSAWTKDPEAFVQAVLRGQADDAALVAYTGGIAGPPRGVVLTHRSLIHAAQSLLTEDPCEETDDVVSLAPLAWLGEQLVSVACALLSRFAVNFPESGETAPQDLREIAPHVVLGPPRVYERLVRGVRARAERAPWPMRLACRGAVRVGGEVAARAAQGRPITGSLRLGHWLAELLVLGSVRDQLGFRRVRRAYATGGSLGEEVVSFLRAVGVNLKLAYGLTESGGLATVHPDGAVTPETVGLPLPGTAVRVAPDGEVLVRSPALFRGYHRDPEATDRVLREGWLHTDDVGTLDAAGHLAVVGRRATLRPLWDGTLLSPEAVEARLRAHVLVRDAWVFVGMRGAVGAAVAVDPDVVADWAASARIPASGYAELSQRPEVVALVRAAVAEVNTGLPAAARIRRAVSLPEPFAVGAGELTAAGTLRRAFLAERYRAVTEALDAGAPEVLVDATTVGESVGPPGVGPGPVRLRPFEVPAVGTGG